MSNIANLERLPKSDQIKSHEKGFECNTFTTNQEVANNAKRQSYKITCDSECQIEKPRSNIVYNQNRNVGYLRKAKSCSYVKQIAAIIYQRKRQILIPFIWGILVGITFTTVVFQQQMLLTTGSREFHQSSAIYKSLFEPTNLNLDRRKAENGKLLFNNDNKHKVNNHGERIYDMTGSRVKNRIYVGVITAEKYLSSRSTAVNNTWGQQVNKIEFFAHSGSVEKYKIPVVELKNASDTEYPPQKKAFEMLKSMCSRHMNDFEWFVRADDDVYIRVEKLRRFLNGIDSNKAIYMGQAGHGIPEVRQRLGLRGHNFCMGGPGVIFSQKALKALCPHLDDCMKEVVSNEEDVEIGRCVTNHLNIECTHAWETASLFYHAYQEEYKEEKPFLGNLFDNDHVQPSLTLHHLKVPRIMYLVHRHFNAITQRSTAQEIKDFEDESTELLSSFSSFRKTAFSNREIAIHNRRKRSEPAISWKTFTTESLYSSEPAHVKRDITNDVLVDLKQVAESAIDAAHNDSSLDSFAFSHVTDGSLRSDFNRGTDYHVNVQFNEKLSPGRNQIRRVHVHRPKSKTLHLNSIRKSSLREDSSLVVIVVVVKQTNIRQFEIFMRNFYEPLFLARGQSSFSHLIVATSSSISDIQSWSLGPSVEEVLKIYQQQYPRAHLLSLTSPPSASLDRAYAYGIAHAHTMIQNIDNDVLILLASTNVTLSSDVVRNCRVRSFAADRTRGQHMTSQLYQPLPFQVYPSTHFGPFPTAIVPQSEGLNPGTGITPNSMLKRNLGFWKSDATSRDHDVISPLCGRFKDLLVIAQIIVEKPETSFTFNELLREVARNQTLILHRVPDRSYASLPAR